MAKARPRSTSTRTTAKPVSATGAAPASSAAAPATPPAAKAGAARATRGRGNGEPVQQFERPQVVMTTSHDEIARRAYDIWLSKGRPMGQDDQNWREAEAALQVEVQQPAHR